ncbi:hypothetical protein SNEBB_001326 [Seison nebaliae]|nr:hypothetical protein SNEBB_001326 [Seison nebaliae]
MLPKIFAGRTKSPQELAKGLREALLQLEKSDKKTDKLLEEIQRYVNEFKLGLIGSQENEPQAEVVARIAQEIYTNNLLQLMINNLHRVEFETKKDFAHIFNNLVRRQVGLLTPTVDHLNKNKEIIFKLINGYRTSEIALNCGMMLRECIRFESLAKIVLYSDQFYNFFDYVDFPSFDIASDAFSTFKEVLTKHKPVVSEFLIDQYDKFFNNYQRLLYSENYVTRRQSLKLLSDLLMSRQNLKISDYYCHDPNYLIRIMKGMLNPAEKKDLLLDYFHVFKLLGEILMERHHFAAMTKYISQPENLKLMMNMLRQKSKTIQFEAFHVFKVFIANPHKPKPIIDILSLNRDKLVDFLTTFHTDRLDDVQFNDEKTYLIKQIKDLEPMATSTGLPDTNISNNEQLTNNHKKSSIKNYHQHFRRSTNSHF